MIFLKSKKQNIVSIAITFITSLTFLVLTLFLFELFGWNVTYSNALVLVYTGALFGLLNIGVQYLSSIYIAFRLKGVMSNMHNMSPKQMTSLLFSKIFFEFILSSLMIWISIEIFSYELIINGFWTLLGIMVSTIVLKGIFSLIVSYHQNKDQLGGIK